MELLQDYSPDQPWVRWMLRSGAGVIIGSFIVGDGQQRSSNFRRSGSGSSSKNGGTRTKKADPFRGIGSKAESLRA
jgi:hypothetical protein